MIVGSAKCQACVQKGRKGCDGQFDTDEYDSFELKKVEIIFQGLLYTETKFPRADEQRTEVEQFVDRVMQNWIILNGHGWKEQTYRC